MAQALKIENVTEAADFDRIVGNLNARLASLPDLNHTELYEELSTCKVPLSEAPTLEKLSEEMQAVQALKDRVLQIVQDALRNHLAYKRAVDILVKGWNFFADGKSEDRRNAESMLRMSNVIDAAAESEAFYRAAANVMHNLDSQHETIFKELDSFRISAKLRDFRLYSTTDSDTTDEKESYVDHRERGHDDITTDWEKFD